MSIDLFFGLPGHRVIRSTELKAYYRFETTRPQSARIQNPADFPAPLRAVLESLERMQRGGQTTAFAAATGIAPLAFTYLKTSLLVSLQPEGSALSNDRISAIANDAEVLYCNLGMGSWLEAEKPAGKALDLAAYTSERCIMRYLEPGDRELLLDPDWFVEGRFFCITPSASHFMQILNHGATHIVEYRAGEGRQIFRMSETDAGRIDAFLAGYLDGRNMNDGTYKFSAVTAADPPAHGLPGRDNFGRWLPPAAIPLTRKTE